MCHMEKVLRLTDGTEFHQLNTRMFRLVKAPGYKDLRLSYQETICPTAYNIFCCSLYCHEFHLPFEIFSVKPDKCGCDGSTWTEK